MYDFENYSEDDQKHTRFRRLQCETKKNVIQEKTSRYKLSYFLQLLVTTFIISYCKLLEKKTLNHLLLNFSLCISRLTLNCTKTVFKESFVEHGRKMCQNLKQ